MPHISLSTKIKNTNDTYEFTFFLPSDVFFSELYIQNDYDTATRDIPCFITLKYYFDKERQGNYITLFSNWVRTFKDHFQRIPISYVIDETANGVFKLEAQYYNTYPGELKAIIIYQPYIYTVPDFYCEKYHRGLIKYNGRVTCGNAGDDAVLKLETDYGQHVMLKEFLGIVGPGSANIDAKIVIKHHKPLKFSNLSAGDYIYLPHEFLVDGGYYKLYDYETLEAFYSNLAKDEYVTTYLYLEAYTAEYPDITGTGTTTLSNETKEFW